MPAPCTWIRRPPFEGDFVSAFWGGVFRGRNPSKWTIRGYLLNYFVSTGDVDAKKMGMTPLESVRP